jgi:hypothetical protein
MFVSDWYVLMGMRVMSILNKFLDFLAIALTVAFFYGRTYGFGPFLHTLFQENGGVVMFLTIAIIYYAGLWRLIAWLKRVKHPNPPLRRDRQENSVLLGIIGAGAIVALVMVVHFIVSRM